MFTKARRAQEILKEEGLMALLSKSSDYIRNRSRIWFAAATSGRSNVEVMYKHAGRTDQYTNEDGVGDLLTDLISEYCPETESALEIGCNAGRRLAAVHDSGLTDLHAVEINPDAIDVLNQTFPEVASDTQVQVGAAQEKLQTLPDNSVDLVYSVAVLQHIQSDTDVLFDEIARVADSSIITLENEPQSLEAIPDDGDFGTSIGTQFVELRDYKEIFQSRGFDEVETFTAWGSDPRADRLAPLTTAGHDSCYVARVFKG